MSRLTDLHPHVADSVDWGVTQWEALPALSRAEVHASPYTHAEWAITAPWEREGTYAAWQFVGPTPQYALLTLTTVREAKAWVLADTTPGGYRAERIAELMAWWVLPHPRLHDQRPWRIAAQHGDLALVLLRTGRVG